MVSYKIVQGAKGRKEYTQAWGCRVRCSEGTCEELVHATCVRSSHSATLFSVTCPSVGPHAFVGPTENYALSHLPWTGGPFSNTLTQVVHRF